MKIEGDEQLIKALKAFPEKLERKVLRSAAGKAATVTARQIRKEAKPASKTVAKHIATKVKLYRTGNLFAISGVKRDTPPSPTGHRASNTAHLIDLGTKPHSMKAWGKVRITHPGARPRPFMAPAAKMAEPEVARIYLKALSEGIEKLGEK